MGELRTVFDIIRAKSVEALEPSRVQYATDLLIEAGMLRLGC